jgi:hypothetical protein
MENIINGENVNTAEKPVTAVNSQPSPKSGKQSTKKTKQPITKEEAAELLTSALSYCLESGLNVIGYNEAGALRLSIDGLEYSNDRIQPVTLSIPASNVNISAPVTVEETVT